MIEDISKIRKYIESQNFKGYDPYDILNSTIPFRYFGTLGQAVAIQIHKLNPFNLRSILGVKKGINPKALGLLLSAYSNLYKINPKDETLKYNMDRLVELIKKYQSTNQSGCSWGYNFDWATPNSFVPKYTPSIVVTAFVVSGLMDYYELFKDDDVKKMIISSGSYILNDLPCYELNGYICFAYTKNSTGRCYNASLLGAETLAKIYSISGEKELLDKAFSAVNGVVKAQKNDGKWNYSIDNNGVERTQIDFHQGFILSSLWNFLKYSKIENSEISKSIELGLDFYYKNQFSSSGRSFWRIPKQWPVDIHNQAQGIISFTQMSSYNKNYLPLAKIIANWTLDNMYNSKRYFFYYRKFKLYSNKASFMRWSQAWMFLALTTLQLKEYE